MKSVVRSATVRHSIVQGYKDMKLSDDEMEAIRTFLSTGDLEALPLRFASRVARMMRMGIL